ncbi:MAG: DEAD/DEAH box helicase [Verrucomicrobiota bacterium]|nr:DEAD/DEAH box helicase [Verrucomicrobiota bacterium]
MQEFSVQIKVPDLWQQKAIRALQAGMDVVVDAPTGAGKTYIFELLVETGLKHQAIYTVPTRALANDKLLEWRRRNWNVGISTGDISENLDAPVIVATLEAQKHRMIRGEGPGLLVIDEYQMLADSSRGINYEMVIALAPPETQLLLMSGSVGNPQIVTDWLRRIGRNVELVSHRERPVPLEEVHIEALPDRIPDSVQGYWPRLVAKALKAGMAPLLIFAPMRKSAETIARQLATALPEEDPILLTTEQKALAGDLLGRLLKARIAFHHSGLDYKQRAGLIEPLAKAGQLRVVVATMGLSSGINFNLRSVLVSDREYRAADRYYVVRPDELLQMFGRAGRRGLDKRGYILVAPEKPRLNEARPLSLKRVPQVDWPALISVMQHAVSKGESPIEAARKVTSRLFSNERVPIGLAEFLQNRTSRSNGHAIETQKRQTYVEILNSEDKWERRRAPVKAKLGEALIHNGAEWRPALSSPHILDWVAAGIGVVCRLKNGHEAHYGRELPLARMGRKEGEDEIVLTKWIHRQLHKDQNTQSIRKRRWTLDRLEKEVLPLLPTLTGGGHNHELVERKGVFSSRLTYSEAHVFALIDTNGRPLIDPPTREIEAEMPFSFRQIMGAAEPSAGKSPRVVDTWHQLGLIDENLHPTRRGNIFSFFNHGEGLAIAAALEDPTYPIEELVFDLANLRAGHRFGEMEEYSGRLGNTCRLAYRGTSHAGYLNKGVPTEYGDGAAETIARINANPQARRDLTGEDLLSGDIERAHLEWRSLLHHVSHAPDYPWDRWMNFRQTARHILDGLPPRPFALGDFPALTATQRQRHKSFLKFD